MNIITSEETCIEVDEVRLYFPKFGTQELLDVAALQHTLASDNVAGLIESFNMVFAKLKRVEGILVDGVAVDAEGLKTISLPVEFVMKASAKFIQAAFVDQLVGKKDPAITEKNVESPTALHS